MDTRAVSEIVGTIMLLGMAIAFFAVVYVSVTSFFIVQDEIYCSVLGSCNGSTVILMHMRGETIPSYTVVCDNGYKATGKNFSIGNSIEVPLDCPSNIMLIDSNNQLQFQGHFEPYDTPEPEPIYEDTPYILEPNEVIINELGARPTGIDPLEAIGDDNDSTYLFTKDHYDWKLFLVDFEVPLFKEINGIWIYARLRNSYDTDIPRWMLRTIVNGTTYDNYIGTDISIYWETYGVFYPINPITNTSWTNNDLQDLQVGLLLNGAHFKNQLQASRFYLEVI